MKPDWENAPYWATRLAMDADGKWYWYETVPYWDVGEEKWLTDDLHELAVDPSIKGNGTLEARP